jgi:hypothetical protein
MRVWSLGAKCACRAWTCPACHWRARVCAIARVCLWRHGGVATFLGVEVTHYPANVNRNPHRCVASLTDGVGGCQCDSCGKSARCTGSCQHISDHTEFGMRDSDEDVCLHVFLELNGPRYFVAAIIGARDRAKLNKDRAQVRLDAIVASDLICVRYIEVLGHKLGLGADV